jgi:hypothetical protein
MSKKTDQENPLANILINVLIPVVALGAMSKNGDKIWNIGPVYGMILALAIPLAYGIWFFLKTKKMNLFSAIGLISIALTGGLTLYLWNDNGSIKPNAALLFGIKEACMPLILGVCVVTSHQTKSPLFRAFIYSDNLFNIDAIESKVNELTINNNYQKLIWKSTLLFATSFFISALLNLLLANYFLGNLDYNSIDAKEIYNSKVAQITGWGFLVIGVPLMVFLGITMWRLHAGIRKLTGLESDSIFQPR